MLRFTVKVLILVTLLASNILNASDLIDSKFNYKFGIGGNYAGLSSFYDSEGNINPSQNGIRTFTFKVDDRDSTFSTSGRININYTEMHNKYFSEFKLSDNLKLGLNLDLAYYSLDNTFTFEDTLRDNTGAIVKDIYGNAQTTNIDVPDNEASTFRLMYINPRLDYYILKEKETKLSFHLGGQIPLSFDKRLVYDDSKFIGDGYFQVDAGLSYKQIFETSIIELNGGYIIRDEIYSNLANAGIGVYFTKVESTHLLLKLDYFQSLNEPKDQEFLITQLPSFESYLNAKFGLNVHYEEFELQLDYNFVLWGKNYWVMNRLNAAFHYYLK